MTAGTKTVEEFLEAVESRASEEARASNGTKSLGRCLAEALSELRPDLGRKLTCSGSDPYYLESRVPLFSNWVRENYQ
jgi:hypothetical protein